MKKRIIGFVLLGGLVLAQAAAAKTLYINDVLRVDMRTGPGNQYRIIDFLLSGTSMQLEETNGDWIKVKTGDKEGWIQSQYTVDQPIARDRLVAAQKQIASLQAENKKLSDQLNTTSAELSKVKSDFDKVSGSATSLEKKLNQVTNISHNAIETESAYRKLQEENELRKVDMEKLKVENVRLKDDRFTDGIKWGAAAVLLGVILAWLISKSAGRKRRSEW